MFNSKYEVSEPGSFRYMPVIPFSRKVYLALDNKKYLLQIGWICIFFLKPFRGSSVSSLYPTLRCQLCYMTCLVLVSHAFLTANITQLSEFRISTVTSTPFSTEKKATIPLP
jgi:hypothetical protein